MAWVEWIDPDQEELQDELPEGERRQHGGSPEGDDGMPPNACPFDDILESMSDALDELCQALQGLPVEDSEEEVRTTLRKVAGSASDSDTLAILLRVFRTSRDAALEGYDSWEVPVEYCRRLPQLCDQSFVGTLGGEGGSSRRSLDLPATVVAAVYAECGRTLALASELTLARDQLQAAVNVFSVIADNGKPEVQQQAANARASLARVWRRLGRASAAQEEYLQALNLYSSLPAGDELAELACEFCEALGEAGGEGLSEGLLATILELAGEKFGEGSDEHLKVLKELGCACRAADRLALAGPALMVRAKVIRSQCSGEIMLGGQGVGRGGFQSPAAVLLKEAQAAEEEAAQAMEATTAQELEAGNLEAAAAAWEIALELREAALGARSPLVVEMRAALQALQQAVAARGSDGREDAAVPDAWDQDDEEPLPSVEEIADNPFAPEVEVQAEPAEPAAARWRPLDVPAGGALGLRPSWAQKPAGGSGKGVALPRPAGGRGEDGWDT